LSVDAATSAGEGRKARGKAYGSIAVVVGLAVLGLWFQPGWLYDWIKVLHIVAVISWMVGLFYLPRLFVYHADAAAGSEPAETFVIMEQRLGQGDHESGDDGIVGRRALAGLGRVRVYGCLALDQDCGCDRIDRVSCFFEPVGAAVRQRNESDDGAAMAHGQ
jgi:hypothetical protein